MKATTSKIISQEGGFLNFVRPLSAGLLLMKNVLIPLAKIFVIPVGLTATSKTDLAIQKKIFGSGITALIISKEEMEDIIKIVKSFEESVLLVKDVSEKIKNEVKEQKGGSLDMLLLDTLAASFSGSILAVKGVIRGGDGDIRSGERVIRAWQNF